MPTLDEIEIERAEQAIGHRLPALYRKLLSEIGHTTSRLEIEIYHPTEIPELYASFFDDDAQLFDPYFPFGCDNGLQELWIIDTATERAASIWHEMVPEDWPEEDWLTYDQWLNNNKAKLSLP